MALPVNEKTVQLSVVGQSSLQKYEGIFTFRCKLTMSEKYKLEMEKSRMLSGVQEATDGLENIISIVCALKARIIKAPEWWTESEGGLNLIDDNVLIDVYDKSVQAEIEWEKEVATLAGVNKENPT